MGGQTEKYFITTLKMNSIKPWKVLSSKKLNHYKIFETRTDRVVSPRTGQEHDAYIVTGNPWVNILAFTEKGEVIMVQQYRHGTQLVMMEIPGGVIDAGESPTAAAARELLEETGYAGSAPKILGKVHPNPAFQTNICHTILIENARKVREPEMESMEDIATHLVPESEFERMILDGRISHSLVLVADLWRRLWRSGAIQPVVI